MEYNVLIVKPDAQRQNFLVDEISADLNRSGYQVIKTSSKTLSTNEFETCFISKNEAHRDYMISGPVVAILYFGESSVGFGRLYKQEFRKKYKIDKIRNVLHTAEPGNEYVAQFNLFFKELDIDVYHQFSDQGVRFQGDETKISKNLQEFCLLTDDIDDLSNPDFQKIYADKRCKFVAHEDRCDSQYSIISYKSVQENLVLSSSVLSVLLLHEVKDPDITIRRAKIDHDIAGVVCYHPAYSLLDTENIRTATFENECFCVGGSFGEASPGAIRVSEELVGVFLGRFG